MKAALAARWRWRRRRWKLRCCCGGAAGGAPKSQSAPQGRGRAAKENLTVINNQESSKKPYVTHSLTDSHKAIGVKYTSRILNLRTRLMEFRVPSASAAKGRSGARGAINTLLNCLQTPWLIAVCTVAKLAFFALLLILRRQELQSLTEPW